METKEHTEIGNCLRLEDLHSNPYLRVDEKGTIYIKLQHYENGIPIPLDLELTSGEIVAMAGDYFTDRNWDMKLNLPSLRSFEDMEPEELLPPEKLGNYLIRRPIVPEEEMALLKAYDNLASPSVKRQQIDLIYKIDRTKYIPFSTTLNEYAKQLMYFIRVKDYGEMLNRNQTHFTPWSIRVYVLGHHLALHYARLAYELKQYSEVEAYHSENEDFNFLLRTLDQLEIRTTEEIKELSHRFHALSLCMEFFSFHYYSDHYAAGHMSMMGDLRVLLKERFGVWGNILANNLHNEVNRIGVFTTKPYDPTPDPTDPPVEAGGDGIFDSCMNHYNKIACLAGMQESLSDLNHVLMGKSPPEQPSYGGLEHLPDVDYKYRQHEPLLILGQDGIIYHRKALSKVRTLSPSDYERLRNAPQNYGYKPIKGKWDAFLLVAKLRLLPCIYSGKLQPLSASELLRIEEEEALLNPGRNPIPTPPCTPTHRQRPPILADQTKKSASLGRQRYGLINSSELPLLDRDIKPEYYSTISLT